MSQNIKRLNLENLGIADLTGIEDFTSLTRLYCEGNQLTSLDISANTALTGLSCHSNQLTSLDISANTALEWLSCNSNQLTNLNVSANTALTWLSCNSNQLTSLDVSANTPLTGLSCHSNQLTNLNVSANTTLTWLSCNSNQLTSLDVSANTTLTGLSCHSNQLTNLNVSANTALTGLSCHSNQLTNLNVSANTALIELYCYSNQLTNLNVSANTALIELYCYSNQLTSLDVSANTTLTGLSCHSNQLTNLNAANGNNANFTLTYGNNRVANSFKATGNPNLRCIQVDDVSYSRTNWTNVDNSSSFSINCYDNTDIDNDGVLYINDDCPNTPTGESVNANGCSISKSDTDNDGVFDNADQCNSTPSGESVNAVGCIQLSSGNFEIFSTTPSCPGINNGKISIKNLSEWRFNFVVTGPNSYNNTFENKLANQPFVIEDLAVGTYNIIAKFSTTGTGQDITGFQITINATTPVSGANKSVDRLGKSSVFTVSGDKKYSIYINDVFQRSETFSDEGQYEITVNNLSVGENHIEIIPENKCRGTIEEWIIIPNSNIKFYPNPAIDLFHIGGLESSDVTVQVFAYNGQRVYIKNHKSVNGIVYFSIRYLPSGLYIVRVSGKQTGDNINFKITKK